MIEQTATEVKTWNYLPPSRPIKEDETMPNFVSLELQPKRKDGKKGFISRFNCRFVLENNTLLEYIAEDSYVIDETDFIDKQELLRMIRNSYTKFNAIFELRRLNTVLRNRSMIPLNESAINLDAILPLLN